MTPRIGQETNTIMTTFHQQTTLQAPISEVYAFLADCNNHEQLMPSSITGWSSTKDTASFTIQGLAKLALQVKERIENEKIVFIPSEKAPFEVSLAWELTPITPHQTLAKMHVEADLNMMMKMMVSGPLQKLVDYQVEQLSQRFA